eukprot:13577122-Alexandrium_andersonii.AAC.1
MCIRDRNTGMTWNGIALCHSAPRCAMRGCLLLCCACLALPDRALERIMGPGQEVIGLACARMLW